MSHLNCKCDCCIYWRRHVHKVAATADARQGKLQRKVTVAETKAEAMKIRWYIAYSGLTSARYQLNSLRRKIARIPFLNWWLNG